MMKVLSDASIATQAFASNHEEGRDGERLGETS